MSNIILLKFSKLVGNVLKPRCAMGKSLGVCLRKKCLGVYWKRGGGNIPFPPPSIFPKNIRELCSEYLQNVF